MERLPTTQREGRGTTDDRDDADSGRHFLEPIRGIRVIRGSFPLEGHLPRQSPFVCFVCFVGHLFPGGSPTKHTNHTK